MHVVGLHVEVQVQQVRQVGAVFLHVLAQLRAPGVFLGRDPVRGVLNLSSNFLDVTQYAFQHFLFLGVYPSVASPGLRVLCIFLAAAGNCGGDFREQVFLRFKVFVHFRSVWARRAVLVGAYPRSPIGKVSYPGRERLTSLKCYF